MKKGFDVRVWSDEVAGCFYLILPFLSVLVTCKWTSLPNVIASANSLV